MTSAERIAIPGAATGLMVYDTDTGNFWCYSGGAWIEIKAGVAAILSDADGDTHIDVEAFLDEVSIRFTAAGVQLMKTDDRTLHLAQEIYGIVPEIVTRPANKATELWSMNYTKLIPVLVQGIQELAQQNELLLHRLQDLETEIALIKEKE
jgi:hypothetical protein